MTYADGRRILDSDAHIMEPPGWLEGYVPTAVRPELAAMDMGVETARLMIEDSVVKRERRASDPEEAATAAEEFLSITRRGWGALGDGDPGERSTVLDLFGFECQIIFPTGSFIQILLSPDHVLVPAVEGMNRGLAEFCADDPRLFSVAYIPFSRGPDVALDVLSKAVADGAGSVLVDSVPAEGSPSHTHPDFDPVWAAFCDHDLPVMLHVGVDNRYSAVRPSFFENDRKLPEFHSDAPRDAVSFSAIGAAPQLFIASLIFDGVLDRHPGLRIGVAELGATWVPGMLRFLDTTFRSFRRLQDLSHMDSPPSDYVRRHFAFTPFAGEDVGYMIETGGSELFMFSSDYPHHEGSDDPIGRFERTMENVGDADRDAFYAGNFERLLGERVN